MNKTKIDPMKIAEIIRRDIISFDALSYEIKKTFVNNLAESFEKEDKYSLIPRHPDCGCMGNREDFNPKQFKEACGVEQ